MAKQNTLDFPFSKFSPECDARGYKATKISETGYFVKASNGVRVDLTCARGGVVAVGYGSNAGMLTAVKSGLEATKAPLALEKVLAGQINFVFDGIEKFFDMVTLVETIKVPETKGRGGRPVGATSKAPKAKRSETKADFKKRQKTVETPAIEGNTHSPSGSETADQAIAAVTARKDALDKGATKSEADVAAIKAANLQRIKEASDKKAKHEKALADLNADTDALLEGFDMPAFLMNDSLMDGKVDGGKKKGAE